MDVVMIEGQNLNVDIKGLGSVVINKTSEGLIVDVYDKTDGGHSLANIALETADFTEGYFNTLSSAINTFDNNLEISSAFSDTAYSGGLSTNNAVTSYFNDNSFDITTLKGLKAVHSSTDSLNKIHDDVLIHITENEVNALQLLGHDYFLTNGGRILTIGKNNNDLSLALISIKSDAVDAILAKESKLAHILFNGDFEEEDTAFLKELGFTYYNESGQYLDFQFDTTFRDASETSDRYSFNLHLTLNIDESECYFSFGTNFGDGFNESVQVDIADIPIVDSIKANIAHLPLTDEYRLLTENYPADHQVLLDVAAKLHSYLLSS
jgi:hypothetical protein